MGMKSKEGEILFGIIHTGHHASLWRSTIK